MIFLANYAQTVNVIGCIKASKTAAAFETTGLALKLDRNHSRSISLAVGGSTTPLDVAAALTEAGEALTVAIVNPTEQQRELTVDLQGARVRRNGTVWRIANADPKTYNEPGAEPNVVIEETQITDISSDVSLPPLSISLYKLPIRR